MNLLLVDDERPSRGQLRYFLQEIAPEAVIYEASGGEEALRAVEQLSFDVVFVDIQMPQMDGLTLAAMLVALPQPPLIIFATAFDQHAFRAFELAALDYVVKPFTRDRLQQSMGRIRQSLADLRRREQQQAAVQTFIGTVGDKRPLNRLWAERTNGNRVLAPYEQIIYLEAKEKRVFVYLTTEDEPLVVRQTLKELIGRLEAHHFCQTHKAYVVNLSFVSEVVPWFSGNFQLRLTDQGETVLPLSRRYAAQLRRATVGKKG